MLLASVRIALRHASRVASRVIKHRAVFPFVGRGNLASRQKRAQVAVCKKDCAHGPAHRILTTTSP